MNEAVARSTDPQTSHDAAVSVPGITDVQKNILYILNTYGAQHDARLVQNYRSLALQPYASESSIRSRRAELAQRGRVRMTDQDYILPSGRKSIIWEAA